VIYRGRCWYTYDFGVTYKVGGTDRFVGYTGYKVCDPAVANPRVRVTSSLGILYDRQAPDFSGYVDFYGEEVSVGNVDPQWVEFYIVEENFALRSDPGDIPPQPGMDMSGIGGYSFTVSFGVPTSSNYGIDIWYDWSNFSGRTIYVKGELYRGGTKVCERSIQINHGRIERLKLMCDAPGSDGEVRIYKSKWYVSEDGGTWHHVETKWNAVYYYEPNKTVGDIVFRPNPIIYGIEMYLNKQFRNYGRAGTSYDYVLMLCSVDSNTHQLVDDSGLSVTSRRYKCVWRTGTGAYPLGVGGRQLTLDGRPYKTVDVYGHGDGRVRSVKSVSGYRVYSIDADKAVVISVVGDYAFDYIDGIKNVDVSKAYLHDFFGIRGWSVVNASEYFAGYITDGSQYVNEYDGNYIELYFANAYSGRFEVERDGNTVFSTDINVPAGGTYRYGPLSGGKWVVYLRWGSVASFKLLKNRTSLTLSVQQL
jgi:hypothetical protein